MAPTSPVDTSLQMALRALPSVTKVLERPSLVPLIDQHGRAAVLVAIRAWLSDARDALRGGLAPDLSDEALHEQLEQHTAVGPRRVINATGIIVHTNLGRAPLAREVLEHVLEVASGYADLEYDLVRGERGSRHDHVLPLLRELTGAEDAVVVNNNAAAVLLTLAAHAAGREVIVSRGELVEIGGGFRVPDVMRMSGARLVEVGTTNKTRAADYREALTADTGLLLKVHRSNFAQVGFVEDASLVALAELARERGVPLFYDAGSGALATNRLHGEVPVEKLLDDGVDLVSFSGDKLLGGPQVGIIAGRAGCIAPLRKHPLLRALRPDKLVLAALIETLRLWRDAPSKIPVVRMLATTPDELHARATSICSALQVANKGIKARVAATSAKVGGGASPLCSVESRAVVLEGRPPEALARTLRDGPVPVVGRIEDDEVWLDVIAIDPHDDPQLIRAVMHAYGTFHG